MRLCKVARQVRAQKGTRKRQTVCYVQYPTRRSGRRTKSQGNQSSLPNHVTYSERWNVADYRPLLTFWSSILSRSAGVK